MIENFVALFTDEHITYVERTNRFFFVPDDVLSHEEKNGLKTLSIGLPLGEIKNTEFHPSLPLLSWIAEHSTHKVFITDKATWLFLCGRDVPKDAIIKTYVEYGLVLVQNKENENLGYGKITPKGIRNLLDRGDYLRRERKSSRTL